MMLCTKNSETLTVSNLISILQAFPQDATVYVPTWGYADDFTEYGIEVGNPLEYEGVNMVTISSNYDPDDEPDEEEADY